MITLWRKAWDTDSKQQSQTPLSRGNRFNLELKARDPAPALTVARVLATGAVFHGVLRQEDIYFQTPSGRLKLRQQSPGRPHLVRYDRADSVGPRVSSYSLVDIDLDDPSVKQWLAQQTAVAAVRKYRRLYLLNNIRIHLDRVDTLGDFVEFEAVASSEPEAERNRRHLNVLVRDLRLVEAHMVAGSYADMVEDSTIGGELK
ncbi:MAG: class IV adenylate cyclase [Patulibacter minatonensis]